jgi:hypothetical protein
MWLTNYLSAVFLSIKIIYHKQYNITTHQGNGRKLLNFTQTSCQDKMCQDMDIRRG